MFGRCERRVASKRSVCDSREGGKDFETNIDKIAAASEYAKLKGVPLYFGENAAFAPRSL
jgi:hypothetical protein